MAVAQTSGSALNRAWCETIGLTHIGSITLFINEPVTHFIRDAQALTEYFHDPLADDQDGRVSVSFIALLTKSAPESLLKELERRPNLRARIDWWFDDGDTISPRHTTWHQLTTDDCVDLSIRVSMVDPEQLSWGHDVAVSADRILFGEKAEELAPIPHAPISESNGTPRSDARTPSRRAPSAPASPFSSTNGDPFPKPSAAANSRLRASSLC